MGLLRTTVSCMRPGVNPDISSDLVSVECGHQIRSNWASALTSSLLLLLLLLIVILHL
jgi:hypothetical protein